MRVQNSKSSVVSRKTLAQLAAAHTVFGLIVVLQVVAYDAWSLITPEMVLWRWIAVLAYLAVSIFVWVWASGVAVPSIHGTGWLLWLLIAANIALASFSVYTQRGMAARAVALYVIPIIVAAAASRATTIFLAAGVSVAAYVVTAASYFVINYSEGFKIELYGEVGFYSLFFVLVAVLVWVVSRPKKW